MSTPSPARAAGLPPRITGKTCWSKRLVKFHVWDAVICTCDPRHVGEVIATHGRDVRVRWENGWLSDHKESELEHA